MTTGFIETIHSLLLFRGRPYRFGKMWLAYRPSQCTDEVGQYFGCFFPGEREVRPAYAKMQLSKAMDFQKRLGNVLDKGGIGGVRGAAVAPAAGCGRGRRRSSRFPGRHCNLSPWRSFKARTRAAGSEMEYCFSRVTIIETSFASSAYVSGYIPNAKNAKKCSYFSKKD